MPRTNRTTLTDKFINSNAAKPTPPRTTADHYDAIVPGLVLRVSASGRRVFYVVYKRGATNKKTWTLVRDLDLRINEYPHLALDRARELARVLLAADNPAAAQAAAQSAKVTNTARTWRALGDLYLAEWAIPRKSNGAAQEDARNLRTQTAALDAVPVRELTRGQVRAVLDAITNRGATVRAARVQALISKVLNFGIDREWVDVNVIARMPKPKPTKRRRVLNEDEVRALWKWMDAAPPAKLAEDPDAANAWRLNRAVLKLRLITAARGNEILNMRWRDLDWAERDHGPWWNIPNTKNGQPHRLPLTKPAIAVLRDVERRATSTDPDAYVFAGIRGKRQRRGVLGAVPVKDFLPRDLRRTAATNMTRLGVPRFDLQRVLNHVDPSVTGDYDLYAYGPEKRAALDKWAARLVEYTRAARLVKGRRA